MMGMIEGRLRNNYGTITHSRIIRSRICYQNLHKYLDYRYSTLFGQQTPTSDVPVASRSDEIDSQSSDVAAFRRLHSASSSSLVVRRTYLSTFGFSSRRLITVEHSALAGAVTDGQYTLCLKKRPLIFE